MEIPYEYGAFPQDADGHEHFFTLSELTDAQIEEGRLAFINEKERRQNIANAAPSVLETILRYQALTGATREQIEQKIAPLVFSQVPEFAPNTDVENPPAI